MLRFLRGNWLFLLVAGGLAVAFAALRTSQSDVGSVAEADVLLSSGRVTVVEFFSNT